MREFVLNRTVPIREQYDVIIAGGGPSGVSAAVAAARLGANVALVERYGMLGGMLSSGNVGPIMGSVARGTLQMKLLVACALASMTFKVKLAEYTIFKLSLISFEPACG